MKKEHFEILLEDMKGDIKQVLEGHHVLHNEIIRTREELCEKIDENTARIKINTDMIVTLDGKIDGVAADLKAHRADTEIHHGVYRVQELKKD